MARKAKKTAKAQPNAKKKKTPKMNMLAAAGGAHPPYCLDIPGEPNNQMCCVWSNEHNRYLCEIRPK
jgi:hypothetical protein